MVAALVLPVVLGFAALSAEYGHGLLTQVENQRVADMASYAGALAYSATSSEAQMDAAARNVARLNGIAPSALAVALVPSPRDGTGEAVHVRVITENTLLLAPILGVAPQLEIAAEAYAGVTGAAGGCILALDPLDTGVTLSGGTEINANDCMVASNAGVSVPCGTKITTAALSHNATLADCQWEVNVKNPSGGPAPVSKGPSTDPLADHAGLGALRNRVSVIEDEDWASGGVSIPSGPSIDFAWNQAATIAQANAAGCNASFANPTWTLTCSGLVVNFDAVTVGGGITLNFNVGGSPNTVYNLGSISSSGAAAIRFGSGTFNVRGGLTIGGGIHTSFGAGTFRFGERVSITTSQPTTFGGPSTFEFQKGILVGGGATVQLGQGGTNRYELGPASSGHAIQVDGGGRLFMADALVSGAGFRARGNILTGGGSCLAIGASADHDIKGNVDAAGGIRLGAGVYTVTGYFALGNQGGGMVNCQGVNTSLLAENVTLVINGGAAPTSGTCAGQAFCAGAGYNGMVLSAPTAGSYAGLAIMGPQTAGNIRGALLTSGASGGRISGAIYFPHGPIQLSGGAGVAGGSDCLQLIGSRITLSGGTSAASECVESGSSGGRVALIQ